MLRFLTAGESHGPCLTAIVEGCPAGFAIDIDAMNRHAAPHAGLRSRRAHEDRAGRGGLRSGVRFGETLGSPITLVVENRDWKNWKKKMSPRPEDRDPQHRRHAPASRPRRPRRRPQVRPRRRAQHPRARERARDGGAGRRRRHRQGLLAPFGIARARLGRRDRRRRRRITPAWTPEAIFAARRGVRGAGRRPRRRAAHHRARSTSARSAATRSAASSRS